MIPVELHLTSSQELSLKPPQSLPHPQSESGALGGCSLQSGFVFSHPFISCLIGSPINLFICEGGWITTSYSISRSHSLRQRGQALSAGWLLDEGPPGSRGQLVDRLSNYYPLTRAPGIITLPVYWQTAALI